MKNKLKFIFPIVCGIFILIADQLSKLYFVRNFTLGESKDFIPYILNFVYIHNLGSAWGMLSGYTALLVLITVVIMVVCLVILIKLRDSNMLMSWAIVTILSGGVGNLIDRIFRQGRVIDFLHFEFWPTFPVFNIADCAVVIGGGLLILAYILDFIKEFKAKK